MSVRPHLATGPFLLFASMVGGCAEQGAFPSLMPRPIELEAAEEEAGTDTPPAAAPAPPDPALVARLAELVALARQGEAAFRAAADGAAAQVARAGAAGSESWIQAQMAVSRLEEVRAPTVVALADLDALALARHRAAELQPAGHAALAAALEEVSAIASAQRAEISRLSALLPPA